MNIRDYLIEQDGVDWQSAFETWRWLLPPTFTLWLVNRFAELVIVTPDGVVHFVDTSSGAIAVVAANREDFAVKIDESGNADDWLVIPLVDQCVAAGKILGPQQCFGYVIPPTLGGKFEIENVEVIDVEVYLHLTGQIHEQIKDLPEGAPVQIVARKGRR
ncbi:MAG: DUF1851 domain-containing protein [Hyphomicrobiaceae bacterium]